MQRIYQKEGLFGFAKGFSACYYGSPLYGFIFFYFYKQIKLWFKEVFGDTINPIYVFISASLVAEAWAMVVGFPFDLIKCRLQSKNNLYKYKNLPEAFWR